MFTSMARIAVATLAVVAIFSLSQNESMVSSNRKLLNWDTGTPHTWYRNWLDENCNFASSWGFGAFGQKLGLPCIRPAALMQSFKLSTPAAPDGTDFLVITGHIQFNVLKKSDIAKKSSAYKEFKKDFRQALSQKLDIFYNDVYMGTPGDGTPRGTAVDFSIRMPTAFQGKAEDLKKILVDGDASSLFPEEWTTKYGTITTTNVMMKEANMPAHPDFLQNLMDIHNIPACDGAPPMFLPLGSGCDTCDFGLIKNFENTWDLCVGCTTEGSIINDASAPNMDVPIYWCPAMPNKGCGCMDNGKATVTYKGIPYPSDYGSFCNTWDTGLPPSCNVDTPPGWCESAWCWVNPDTCSTCNPGSEGEANPLECAQSAYFPDDNLFYSYPQCDSEDLYSPTLDGCECMDNGMDAVTYQGLEYPANYGSYCSPWDTGLPPSCDAAEPPSWCTSDWCWVDPEKCATCNPGSDDNPLACAESSYFPGAGLYYSYDKCGNPDDYTSTISK